MRHSLEHFHTFLLYRPSYTISAVIFHSTVWAPSGSSLHFSQFSMNTQKGKGKEMKKLSSTMPIPFSAIYAPKFDPVLKMNMKYTLSHMRIINLSSQIASCGNTGFSFSRKSWNKSNSKHISYFLLPEERGNWDITKYSHSQMTITAYKTALQYTVHFNIILPINPTDYFYEKNIWSFPGFLQSHFETAQ